MDYQISINNVEILSGNIIVLFLVVLVVSLAIAYALKVIWHKLRAYETMKYEFITIIAHKFRTPLTQIKWILESILANEIDTFKKESLQSLGKSNDALIGLTNTLVELTDSENKEAINYSFEKINICELVNKIMENLKDRLHEKNLFFGITCSTPEIYVNADRTRIEFVIQTLVENSINYSPPGRNIEIYIIEDKGEVALSVIDHGIGISPNDIPRVFTKFFRASNAQTMDTEGFGVGLYLANSIVKRHSGKLEVFSGGLNMGSTFTIVFPSIK